MLKVRWVWFYAFAAALLCGGNVLNAWQLNLAALRVMKGEDATISLPIQGCSQSWLAGRAAGKRFDLLGQHNNLEEALDCSPKYIPLLQALLPVDISMARRASQRYPDHYEAWFWLAEATAPTDPLTARQAYIRTVALAPNHGLSWCRLGLNYEVNGELGKASEAYLNCCQNGDPGSNGCYGAGRTMERMGNLHLAIDYYRLSNLEGALKRAEELEANINP